MALFVSFNGCVENHLQYNHFELMSIKWTSLVELSHWDMKALSSFFANRSNFCLRNSEGINLCWWDILKKLYWGSLLLHLESKYLWANPKCMCVCLHVPDVDHPEKELFIAVFLPPLKFLSFYDPDLERSGLPATQWGRKWEICLT